MVERSPRIPLRCMRATCCERNTIHNQAQWKTERARLGRSGEMMKAVVNERYGSPDVLNIREIATPTPQAGEILVKVHATTVGRTDSCALRAHPFFVRPYSGLLRPKRKVLGLDFAGIVEAVSKDVTNFTQGDRVFGLTPGGLAPTQSFFASPQTAQCASCHPGNGFARLWFARVPGTRTRT